MLMLLAGGCAPDKTGETGETGETGDSGETGETGLDDVPAVEFEYFPANESMFAASCQNVIVDGEVVPIHVDADNTVDCGRVDEAGLPVDILLSTSLEGNVVDEHLLTAGELNAAVQAVVGKASNRSGKKVSFDDTCSAVCDGLFQAVRKGTCPEFKGSAVALSSNALTTALNGVEDGLVDSLDPGHTGLLDGAWCWVSTRPSDLLPQSGVVQSPVNIWWGVIYGLRNYSAGSVVYPPDGSAIAMYGVTYKVPGKVANQYAAFLASPLTATYPSGSSFSLTPQTAKYAYSTTNGISTVSGSWPSWWTAPTGTGIIDPIFGDPKADLQALDTFIAAHAGIATTALFGTEGDCPTSDAFPWDDPSSLTGDPTHNNETISLDPECPEAP